ncbi:MAG: glycosyltransferase family 4 protein [Armatimonadetes bacterium]|nr:glycosyltransferase family 4 protein [Armatimonadota bacterium]
MRICVVTGIFPPDIGGPASYVPRIAVGLTERGHTVSVVTLSDSVDCDDTSYSFPVRRILRQLPRMRRMLQTVRTVVALARKSEIVFSVGLYIECLPASRISGTPLVMRIGGDWAWERVVADGRIRDGMEEFQLKRYTSRVVLLKALRSWVTRRADRVITNSDYLRGIVLGWGVPPDRLDVVQGALDELAQASRVDLPPFAGHTVVTVGRLIPLKRVDSLMRVVAGIAELRLLVVGDGPQRDELEDLATSLEIGDRVLFVGRVPQPMVSAYLCASDLFVLNSTGEGLPNAVIEAMQAGIPVIATQTPGTAELIQHGITGLLVPPGNEEALRASLEVLLGDPDKRSRLAEAARQRLEQSFQWEQLVGETESLLLSCAKKREGSQIAHE